MGSRRRGFAPRSRYSCQHSHSRPLHGGSSPRFPAAGKLPYRYLTVSRRFGAVLSPVYCRRMSTRPVSCYALFEWVAASEPTSWLSGRTHILCHSARTSGPWRAVWAVSLSSTQLSPHALTAGLGPRAFGVRLGLVGGEAPAPIRCSTSRGKRPTLALKLFRGERDISGFDWPFTPIHGSSPRFSTQVGSALHGVLPPPQPAHG